MKNIFIIEKDRTWRKVFKEALAADFDLVFWDPKTSLEKELAKKHYALVLADKESYQKDLFELIQWLTATMPYAPVVVFSEEEKAEEVVRAIKCGAFDYVTKPFSAEKIRHVVEQANESRSLKNEIDYLRHEQDTVYDFNRIIASSPVMQEVVNTLKKFSQVDATILMTGETGTGKSFLAGSVHFNSQRRKKPFIHVNCANIPETLLESELFGHEKGSFTGADKMRVGRFEQAHGGTLFLDEIGELSLPIQSKLLRALESKSFERIGSNKTIYSDTRIIAATNRRLSRLVEENLFREDLYFRINILNVRLPPLRQRKACIRPVADFLLQKYCRALGRKRLGFSKEILEWMESYPWPGNIREMANCIERAIILEEGEEIGWKSFYLPEIIRTAENGEEDRSQVTDLKQSEKDQVLKALEQAHWVQKHAAEHLGISPRSLNYKIKKFNISHPSWRKHT
ncbi:MAG: sigma-54 dependent transcriptional regulator [Desulfohalobiaceae bacterium]|nr:sigma-54 dependent transcriptional regulator [Desulfohalobiaceae bacterium]